MLKLKSGCLKEEGTMLQIQIFKVGTGVPTLEKWAMFLLSTFIHLFSIITRIITYIPSYIYFVGIAFMFTTFLVLLFQSKY